MLELTHVTKRFGSILALDDVTFTVPAGQIVGSARTGPESPPACAS